MANFSRRERTTRSVEYLHHKGDCVGELNKALKAAHAEYCHLNGKDVERSHIWDSDDWAWIDFDDEHVIIRFEVSEVKS